MFTTYVYLYAIAWLTMSGSLLIMPMLGMSELTASYYSNFIQILSTVINTILCIRAVQVFEKNDPMRLVWGLLGIGILSWGLGQTLYTGYIIINNGEEPPYPWYADIGFALMPFLMIMALVIFMRAMAITPPKWGITLALIVLTVILALAVDSALPNLDQAENQITYLTILYYAVMDPLLLAATVLSATILSGGLLARPWWFCFGGLMFYYLSNRAYDIQVAKDVYVSGSWVDLGWPLSFTLIGIAAILAYNIMVPEE